MHSVGRRWPHATERRVVVLLTAAFVLLGTAFALLVPMFGNFDEQTHLDRARYTARHPSEVVGPELRITHGSWGALSAVGRPVSERLDQPDLARPGYLPFAEYPGGDEGDAAPCPGVCQNIQYAHPPAWYVLMAPVTAVLESTEFPRQVLAVRLVDVLLAAPVVALAWLTAREVWPGRPRRRIAVAALVAGAGPLAYTASAVNNDALLVTTVAAAVAVAARILRRGPTIGAAALLGAMVTVGLLTKVQMVLVAPAVGLAVLVAPASARDRVRAALAFAVPASVGAAWWAFAVLDEGPLSPESSELLGPPVPGPWSDDTFLPYAIDKLSVLVGRFWGTYDSPVSFLPSGLRMGLSWAAVLLALAWLVARGTRRPTAADLRWLVLAAVPAAVAVGVLWASFDGHRRTGELRALAPRYLYPALAVFAIGAVGAAATVADRVRARVPRWGLPAGIVATAAVGGAASLRFAVGRAYGTGSLPQIVDHAGIVGPLGRPGPALAVVGALWLAAVGAAARLTLQRPFAGEADRSPAGAEPAGARH